MDKARFRFKILNILYGLLLLSLLSIFVKDLFFPWRYDSWQISEFLINYQGGFVRRGLLGELLFLFVKYTGVDVVLLIKILSVICCIAVCTFFVRSFAKKAYPLYILPLCFFCGGIIMSEVWIRKDFLMFCCFIPILLIYVKKTIPFWLKIILINLLSVFMILNHEVFAFFSLPILFLLFFYTSKTKYNQVVLSLFIAFVTLLPSIFAFVLVSINHGDRAMAQAIWDSWNIIANQALTVLPGNNALDAIGWKGIDTLFFHFNINFGMEEYYILSIWYWLFVFFIVYYITMNALLVFKKRPEIYTKNDRIVLSSIWLFQGMCLLPMFICLSIDYLRIFFYLTASTFALFLIVPKEEFARIFPAFWINWAKKSNEKLDLILSPSRTTVAFFMLTVGIAYSGFVLKTIWMSTMIYRIFLLFSQPILLIKDFFNTL
jgi:hypothetical protein